MLLPGTSVVFALGVVAIMVIGSRHPDAFIILASALMLRFALALVHAYVFELPDSSTDAGTFARIAATLSNMSWRELLSEFRAGTQLYPWCLAWLYKGLGQNALTAQSVNVVFSTLIVWNVYRIADELWGRIAARKAGWITVWFPTLLLYSAITHREVAIVFPLTLGVYYGVRWLKTSKSREIVFAFLALGVSLSFHSGVLAAIAVLAFVILVSWFEAMTFGRWTGSRTVALLLVVLGCGAIVATGWGLHKIGRFGNFSLSEVAQSQARAARDRAAYLQDTHAERWVDLLWYVPLRISYLLYAPFPWMIRLRADLFGLCISTLNLGLTLLTFRKIHRILHLTTARLLAASGMTRKPARLTSTAISPSTRGTTTWSKRESPDSSSSLRSIICAPPTLSPVMRCITLGRMAAPSRAESPIILMQISPDPSPTIRFHQPQQAVSPTAQSC